MISDLVLEVGEEGAVDDADVEDFSYALQGVMPHLSGGGLVEYEGTVVDAIASEGLEV